MSRYYHNAQDPVSCLTHAIGAILSLVGLVVLLIHAAGFDNAPLRIGAYVAFGVSMLALYTSSSLYHYTSLTSKRRLTMRKLDHAMIYVLIAGTYTAICLLVMPAAKSVLFISVIWGVAAAGVITTIFFLQAPRWLHAIFYLLMGWAILFDFPAFLAMPRTSFLLVAAGGAAYSIGAVIYIIKRPNFSKNFGFHEFFHIFILVGSALHFAAIFLL